MNRQLGLALLGEPHRLWCGLLTSDGASYVPRCTCGQLTVEQLVGWWAAAASPRVVPASAGRYHVDRRGGIFATPAPGNLSNGR